LLLEALARAGYLERRTAAARTDWLFEQGEGRQMAAPAAATAVRW